MSEGSVATQTSLPRSPGRRIIRREEAQSWIDGYRFLAEARRCADQAVQNVRAACEEGRAKGLAEGRSAGAAEAAVIIAEASAQVERYLASIESQVAELSLSIVEQILGSLDDAEAVTRAAKKALAAFRREKHVNIRVSPQVLEAVQRMVSASEAAEVGGPTLHVEADPRLTPTQCRIATEFAAVDASLDAQLDIVRRLLTATGDRTRIA